MYTLASIAFLDIFDLFSLPFLCFPRYLASLLIQANSIAGSLGKIRNAYDSAHEALRRRILHSIDFLCQRVSQTASVLVDNACVLSTQPNFVARMSAEGRVCCYYHITIRGDMLECSLSPVRLSAYTALPSLLPSFLHSLFSLFFQLFMDSLADTVAQCQQEMRSQLNAEVEQDGANT